MASFTNQSPSLLKQLWNAVKEITGVDYWFHAPEGHHFNIVKHIKRTCQLAGAMTMTAFMTYSFSNWFQWRTYNISMPWNFFGSHTHTVALCLVTAISSWYFLYGATGRALYEFQSYKQYVSYKYLGNEYNV